MTNLRHDRVDPGGMTVSRRRLGYAGTWKRSCILIVECDSIIELGVLLPFVRPEIIKTEDVISRIIACTLIECLVRFYTKTLHCFVRRIVK